MQSGFSITAHWREVLYGALGAMALLGVLLAVIGKVPASYNVRNLLVRWKTTLMTALAFTMIVSLMTIMMAFVRGMYSLTESSGQPGNVVILASGSTDEGFSTLAFDDVKNVERMSGIETGPDGKRLASKEVFVVGNQQIPAKPGEKSRRRFVQIRGLEDPALAGQLHGIALKAGGHWFSEAGIEEGAAGDKTGEGEPKSGGNLIQAVLGSGIASEMARDRGAERPLDVGDTFELADRTWKITGVLDSLGSTFDSEIWVKRQIAGEYFGKPSSYSSVVVRTAGEEQAKALATQVQESKETALNAIPEKTYYSNMAETSKQFLYAIVVVVLVMGIGGVFGVMNTMFAAISQRTKDIGVLRILGYRRRQILISFLLESLVLAFVGGVLGCAVGCLADGWTARSMVSSGAGGKSVVLALVVSKEILAAGLLLSLVMGLIGGLIPALSAMRLRALESLR